jgi:transmembrane 9 superfamily protein 2/4
MASPAGYAAAYLYKTFGGQLWHRATLLTAIGFPSIMFGAFFTVNLVLWIGK